VIVRIANLSEYEASQAASPYIESEHLLLGLLRLKQNYRSYILALT
jgi:hypothetical protein